MELSEKVQAGHMAVCPLEAVNTLHNLWLSPVVVIPDVRRRPRPIFDYTWSGLNDILKRLASMEVMRFGVALRHILKQVLTADPRIGPVYLSKVDLVDVYMRLWVSMEDAPSVFLLTTKTIPGAHI